MRMASMAKANKATAGRKRHYLHVINEHGHWNNKIALVKEALDDPLKWKTPSLIFVNSMSDLFHKDVPLDYIQKVFEVMRKAHWHQFQVLTKRSERLAELASELSWPPNVWMGVSVENADYRHRIDDLRRTPAKIKFLSLEPLLGPLPRLNLRGIDWVIVGGESGPGARPMLKSWVTDLRDQCNNKKLPFFFKQWGGVNKKATGCTLEGHIWHQMPDTKSASLSSTESLVSEPTTSSDLEQKRPQMDLTVGEQRQTEVRRNKKGEVVVASAYQEFIVNLLKQNSGVIAEKDLDAEIQRNYDAYWGRTDRAPWGDIPSKAKWKQNVAAAKAGLDHRGEVIRIVVKTAVKCRTNPRKFKTRVRVYRVYLGPHYQWIVAGIRQRDQRRRIAKKVYPQLEQPAPRYIVPTPPQMVT